MHKCFQGRVVLLAGVPAIGKTTISTQLAEKIPQLSVIHFGALIRKSIKQVLRKKIGEAYLRRNISNLSTPEVLAAARQELVNIVQVKRNEGHVLIDSHAVSKVPYGFRSTPDEPTYAAQLAYDLVIQLYASSSVVEERRRKHPAGRTELTEDDMLRYEFLQAAVATLYAATSCCPLCYIAADGPVEAVVARVLRSLAEVGITQ